MGDRWPLLGGALLSLLLLFAVFGPRAPDPGASSRPTSTDDGPGGQLAAARWLAASGIPTTSFRQRFTRLPDAGFTAAGNVLVMVMPQYLRVTAAETSVLWEWVAAGNTVLLLAALNDTPAWSYAGDGASVTEDLAALTGLSFRAARFRPGTSPLVSRLHTVEVHEDHWLTRGVATLAAESDLPTTGWTLETGEVEYGTPFELAYDPEDGRGVLWLMPDAGGQWVVSAYGSLLANKVIAQADNRQLLANVVSTYLGPGGTVIFDDRHQGLGVVYDARAFVGDPRFVRSMLLLAAAWLAWLLFAGAPPPPASVREAALPARPFVPLVGEFLAERVDPVAAGERLFSDLWRDLAARLGRGSTEVLLDRLAATGRVDASLVAELRRFAEALAGRRRVDLVTLHNRLNAVRKALRQ